MKKKLTAKNKNWLKENLFRKRSNKLKIDKKGHFSQIYRNCTYNLWIKKKLCQFSTNSLFFSKSRHFIKHKE